MPAHDWTLVEAGIFHDSHTVWIGHLRTALNEGVLPEGYYALAEQHAGRPITDVLTLQSSPSSQEPAPLPPDTGGTAVAEAPHRVRHRETIGATLLARRRSLAIRHVSGHRLVALLEIVSPGNKDRACHVDKAVAALDAGIHLLIVDLFPPGSNDPGGLHSMIRQRLELADKAYSVPATEPMTMASYAAGPRIEVYLENCAVGESLPDMPLFLRPDRYVTVRLQATYDQAYRGFPSFWRQFLESRPL